MNDTTSGYASPNRTATWIVYVLQLIGMFFWPTFIAGLIVNIVKHGDVRDDPVIDAHFRWQVRTFWWSLVWSILGIALWVFFIGLFIIIGAAIWTLYRVVRGMMMLSENRRPKFNY